MTDEQEIAFLTVAGPDGVVVVETEANLTAELRTRVQAHLEGAFPGRRVLLLEGGMKLARNGIERLEQQMQAILASQATILALLEDTQKEEDEEPVRTLEGEIQGRARDPDTPL